MVLAPERQLPGRPPSSQSRHDGPKASNAEYEECQANAGLQRLSTCFFLFKRVCCVGPTVTEMIMTIFSSSFVQFMRRIRSSIVDMTIVKAAIWCRRKECIGGRCCGGVLSL